MAISKLQVLNTTNCTPQLVTGLGRVFVILTGRPGAKQKEQGEARGSTKLVRTAATAGDWPAAVF